MRAGLIKIALYFCTEKALVIHKLAYVWPKWILSALEVWQNNIDTFLHPQFVLGVGEEKMKERERCGKEARRSYVESRDKKWEWEEGREL